MWNAVNDKFVELGISDEDWRIDQRVVVGRAVRMRPRACIERCDRTHPARCGHDGQFVWTRSPACPERSRGAGLGQERCRAIDEREIGFNPVGSNRHLTAVDAVRHDHRGRPAGLARAQSRDRHTPAIFRGLLYTQRAAALRFRGHGFDMTCELADEI